MTRSVPRSMRGFLHLTPYYKGNSLRGVQAAAKRRPASRRAIDLDFRVTSDGVLANTHYPAPLNHGFRDPEGKWKRNWKVETRPWADVARLRAGGADAYRINRAEAVLLEAARLGVRVEFEAKDSPAFQDPELWAHLAHTVRQVEALAGKSLNIAVKTIVKGAYDTAGLNRLRHAHEAGFTTLLLPRGSRTVPRAYEPYIDLVRGRFRWI